MRLPDLNIKKKSKSTAFAGIRRARGKFSLLTPEHEWVNMLLIQKKHDDPVVWRIAASKRGSHAESGSAGGSGRDRVEHDGR